MKNIQDNTQESPSVFGLLLAAIIILVAVISISILSNNTKTQDNTRVKFIKEGKIGNTGYVVIEVDSVQYIGTSDSDFVPLK
jgi:hypothetical protein